MPIRDQAAMESSLDNDYGATHGPNAPDEHTLHLFIGDPDADGFEVPDATETEAGTVANGYAPVTVANDATWAAAAGGLKSTAAPVEFPAALAEYPGTVTHFALYDPVAGAWWDACPLLEPVEISSAGDGPLVTPTIFYDDNLEA